MNKVGKVIIGIILAIFIIAVIAFMIGIIYYNNSLKAYSNEENGQEIVIEIPTKTGVSAIADLLEEKNVIKDSFTFKVYLKLHKKVNLQAGKYVFNNGKDDVESVVKKLTAGEIIDDSISITFVEGKNMRYIAKTIAAKTNNTEDDVFNLVEDVDYLTEIIDKYWFLTEEMADVDIYYPLEGYLMPDTYTFENKDVSVKTIFAKMLDATDKYLSANREDIESTNLTVHQLLTLASIAELEGSEYEERAEIVGVFYNRLNKNMSLGSDVTTYYALKKELTDGDLSSKEIATENPYNTRAANMNGKIPIGPICNPSKDSIKAVIYPKDTDALYFVSDKNGKAYFTKTYEEHQTLIKNLKESNLWYTY